MMDRKIKPLFIWAGGKDRLMKHYKPLMPAEIDTYAEPFMGGGAMYCYVANHYNPKRMVINDINGEIINIYKAIKEDVDYFCILLDRLTEEYLPLDYQDRYNYYYELRHQNAYHYQEWDATKQAAVLYFLLLTSFNGIWQVNINTNGRFGCSCGKLNHKKSVYDYNNVINWHYHLQRTEILCGDWEYAMVGDASNTFIFLDPPYRDCRVKYDNPMSDDVHTRMLKLVQSYKFAQVWYCNHDKTGDGFFDEYKPLRIDHTHTAGRCKKNDDGTYSASKTVEILIRNR